MELEKCAPTATNIPRRGSGRFLRAMCEISFFSEKNEKIDTFLFLFLFLFFLLIIIIRSLSRKGREQRKKGRNKKKSETKKKERKNPLKSHNSEVKKCSAMEKIPLQFFFFFTFKRMD